MANASKVLVSMYDGPEQIEKFKKMTRDANVPEDFIILEIDGTTNTMILA